MFEEKKFEQKLFTGIIALCSSLLTNTLTDFISTSDYIITMSDNKIMLSCISIHFSTLMLNIIQIIILFFIIFMILTFTTKLGIKIYRKNHIRKLEDVNETDLVNVLYSIKHDTLELYYKFTYDKNICIHDSIIKINLKELNKLILQLNKYFSKPTNKGSQKLSHLFRKYTSSSYITSINSISYYELEGIFDLLQFMLNEATKVSSYDPLLESDCKNMSTILKKLKSSLSLH